MHMDTCYFDYFPTDFWMKFLKDRQKRKYTKNASINDVKK